MTGCPTICIVRGASSAVLNMSGVSVNCTTTFDCAWDSLIIGQLINGSADIILGLIPWTDAIASGELDVYWMGAEFDVGVNLVIRYRTA